MKNLVINKRQDVFTPILNKSLSRLPSNHKTIARTPLEVFLADANCRDRLHFLLASAADAQIKKLQLFPVTNISDRIAELIQKIDGSLDADEIEPIQAELVKLRSPEAEDIATLRRREITPVREFAEKAASLFREWVIKSLEGIHAESIRHEKQMFADLSLPWEETVISRRYKQAITEIRQLNTVEATLRWFGIPSLIHTAEQLKKTQTAA